MSANNLALLLQKCNRLDEATPLLEKALEGCKAQLGNLHPYTLTCASSLAGLLHDQRRLSEAEPLYVMALDSLRAQLGDQHPDALTSANNLGSLYYDQGRLDDAEQLFREALHGRRSVLGDKHHDTITCANNLAYVTRARHVLNQAAQEQDKHELGPAGALCACPYICKGDEPGATKAEFEVHVQANYEAHLSEARE